jgi:dipeptidyl aminopeptidase/acylaminoacyl peptidase
VDERPTFLRLTFGLAPHRPTWRPDGTRITVGAAKDGGWRLVDVGVDGTVAEHALLESPRRLYPNAWSPDGRHLVFQEERPETGWDLFVLDLDPAGRPLGAPRLLAATPSHETNAVVSPDGRWVAYESDELDSRVEVYLRSFPDGGGKTRASSEASRWPAWGPGGQLYQWSTGTARLHVVGMRSAEDRLLPEPPRPVWPETAEPPALARLVITPAGARYDVHPAAGRFLFLETAAPSLEAPFASPVLVLDWAASTGRARPAPP